MYLCRMNKKIRIVWMLTMASAVVLICLQSYWLKHELKYSMTERENAAISAINKAYEDYANLCSIEYQSDNHAWVFTALAEKEETPITNMCSPRTEIVNGTNMIPDDVILEKDTFLLPQLSVSEASEVTAKLLNDKKTPFNKQRLDSLIQVEAGTSDFHSTLDKLSEYRFFPDTVTHASLMDGKLVYFFPLNPLAYRGLTVTMAIDVSPILATMRWRLLLTVLLTVLLIVSMGYQIKVILYQKHIDKMRSDFVHTMIHELKRPVQMLRMCISLFGGENMSGTADNKEMTAIVREETDNLTAYLAKLRDVLRAEERIPLTCEPFNLRTMIEHQIETFRHGVKDKDVNITLSYEFGADIVTADRNQLANVLSNLLENACKYSGESVNINVICCSSAPRDGCFDLSVADDGIGIPVSEQGKVFCKFYRGASSNGKMVPGIGLGLSFVRMIAEAHGGTASLQSREDVGTTVTVTIPIKH